MKGADVWLLNKTSSGSWELVDAYAPGFVKPVADAHQDLKLLGVERNGNGSLIAAWRRFLAPCDLQDLPIIADTPIHVIWAYQKNWGYHGTSSRGGKVVNFIPAASVKTSAANSQGTAGSHTIQRQMIVAESGNTTAADKVLKTLDLVYSVAVPAKETTYFVHYFKLPSDRKYHIVKYEPIGRSPQLHHGVAYTCAPNQNAKVEALKSLGPFDRFKEGMICEQFYMLLTPNQTAHEMPPTAGIPMGTSSTKYLALELHYNNPELVSGIKDERAGIRVYYTDKLRPQDMGLITLNQPVLAIPPGVAHYPANVSVCPSSCTKRFKQPVTLVDAFLHMHGAGKSMKVRRYRGTQELAPLADLRAFDYAFQGASILPPDARVLQPGDVLTLQCTYDSRGRTNITRGGPGTNDEMCFAWISYYPAQDDMGLCYSFGDRAIGLCSATRPEDSVWRVFRQPDAAVRVMQLINQGVLTAVAKPNVTTMYKSDCSSKALL
eukprot:gene6322-6557_t